MDLKREEEETSPCEVRRNFSTSSFTRKSRSLRTTSSLSDESDSETKVSLALRRRRLKISIF